MEIVSPLHAEGITCLRTTKRVNLLATIWGGIGRRHGVLSVHYFLGELRISTVVCKKRYLICLVPMKLNLLL